MNVFISVNYLANLALMKKNSFRTCTLYRDNSAILLNDLCTLIHIVYNISQF